MPGSEMPAMSGCSVSSRRIVAHQAAGLQQRLAAQLHHPILSDDQRN
jgi:hypothetical protein